MLHKKFQELLLAQTAAQLCQAGLALSEDMLTADEVRAYLQKHDISNVMQQVVNEAVIRQTIDPLADIADALLRVQGEKAGTFARSLC